MKISSHNEENYTDKIQYVYSTELLRWATLGDMGTVVYLDSILNTPATLKKP